jgi:hypothetical protein
MSTIALGSTMRSLVRAIRQVVAGAIFVFLAACGGSSLDTSPAYPSGTAAQRSNLPNLSIQTHSLRGKGLN